MNQIFQSQRTVLKTLTVSPSLLLLCIIYVCIGDAVEDDEQRMERKYPSLLRQYGTEAPPLPPRPPETLPPGPDTPPSLSDDSDDAYEKPPPPSTRPPG